VRQAVEPIQAVEAEKVRAKIREFAGRVESYRKATRQYSYFAYASGPVKAFSDMDKVTPCSLPCSIRWYICSLKPLGLCTTVQDNDEKNMTGRECTS
jgi:hypothetical protein